MTNPIKISPTKKNLQNNHFSSLLRSHKKKLSFFSITFTLPLPAPRAQKNHNIHHTHTYPHSALHTIPSFILHHPHPKTTIIPTPFLSHITITTEQLALSLSTPTLSSSLARLVRTYTYGAVLPVALISREDVPARGAVLPALCQRRGLNKEYTHI